MEMNLQAGTIKKPFLRTAIAFQGDIHPFHPFPKAVDRKAYEALPTALKKQLVQVGEAKLGYAFPVIRATDYMRFKKDGDHAGVREYLFGKATGQEDLCLFAAKDFQAGQGQLITDEVNGGNLFYRMQTVFHYQELMTQNTSATLSHRDVYYPSVGLFLVHSDTLDLAVKAGDNADSHNHNDTGSITLYKNGLPILADIGVETYTQKTFSPRRYEIWTMQSGYHNLPTICGTDQKDGAEYRAENVVTVLTVTEPSISMELAAAYPSAQSTVSDLTYVRKVTLKKSSNTIVLEDHTNAQDVILNFITYEKPVILSDGKLSIGEASASFEGADLLAIETLPITDARLRTAWDHDLYRIRLKGNDAGFRLTIQ